MKQKKDNKGILNTLKAVAGKKNCRREKRIFADEDSEFLNSLDGPLEPDEFHHCRQSEREKSWHAPGMDQVSSEMLDDMISLVRMVEHMETILTLAATGKTCPLHGMREAGAMVDQAGSTLEKWFQFFGPDA